MKAFRQSMSLLLVLSMVLMLLPAFTVAAFADSIATFDDRFGGSVGIESYESYTKGSTVSSTGTSYYFQGWFTGIDGDGSSLAGIPEDGTAYYAKWTTDQAGKQVVITEALDFTDATTAAKYATGKNGVSFADNTLALTNAAIDCRNTEFAIKLPSGNIVLTSSGSSIKLTSANTDKDAIGILAGGSLNCGKSIAATESQLSIKVSGGKDAIGIKASGQIYLTTYDSYSIECSNAADSCYGIYSGGKNGDYSVIVHYKAKLGITTGDAPNNSIGIYVDENGGRVKASCENNTNPEVKIAVGNVTNGTSAGIYTIATNAGVYFDGSSDNSPSFGPKLSITVGNSENGSSYGIFTKESDAVVFFQAVNLNGSVGNVNIQAGSAGVESAAICTEKSNVQISKYQKLSAIGGSAPSSYGIKIAENNNVVLGTTTRDLFMKGYTQALRGVGIQFTSSKPDYYCLMFGADYAGKKIAQDGGIYYDQTNSIPSSAKIVIVRSNTSYFDDRLGNLLTNVDSYKNGQQVASTGKPYYFQGWYKALDGNGGTDWLNQQHYYAKWSYDAEGLQLVQTRAYESPTTSYNSSIVNTKNNAKYLDFTANDIQSRYSTERYGVRYSENTLYLNNACIDTSDKASPGYAIKLSDGATINVSGSSILDSWKNTILCEGDLTITGAGILKVNTTEGNGAVGISASSITFSPDVTLVITSDANGKAVKTQNIILNGLSLSDSQGNIVHDYANATYLKISKTSYETATCSAITANILTYDESAQALVTAPAEVVGGSVVYCLGTSTAADENWNASIPRATDVGIYYVWFKVAGDNQHHDSDASCVDVTIKKASPSSLNFTYTAPEALAYDGTPKEASLAAISATSGMGDITAVLYKTGGGDWTETSPSAVGTYAVGIRVSDGLNYNATATEEVITSPDWTFSIVRGEVASKPVVSMADYTYGTVAAAPSATNNLSGGTVEYYYAITPNASSESRILWDNEKSDAISAGTYYMIAVVSETANYNSIESEADEFVVAPSKYSAPTALLVNDTTATVAQADRSKKLEYAIVESATDEKYWNSVPQLSADGTFTLSGLTSDAGIVYLRQRASADGNYDASDWVQTSFELTKINVSYNANRGTGTVPKNETVVSGGSITVASPSGISRIGYTFSKWNTRSDGSGTSYNPGEAISATAVLKAQWTPKTYTIKFDANGGSGNMGDIELAYDTQASLSANAFTEPAGTTFAGWSLTQNGNIVYGDKQTVKNLASEGTVTLYAVWSNTNYKVKLQVESSTDAAISAYIMRGTTTLASITTGHSITSGGGYSFSDEFKDVPVGIYTLIVTQSFGPSETRKATTDLTVNGNCTVNLEMPVYCTDSKLVVSAGSSLSNAVLGGLDKEAAEYGDDGKRVEIEMQLEPVQEMQLPENAGQNEKVIQEEIEAIKEKSNQKSLEEFIEYIKINLTKKETPTGGSTTSSDVKETNNVLALSIPYDFTDKGAVSVYNNHNGTVNEFTKSTSGQAGTFTEDRAGGTLTIFSNEYSTYAIAYTAPSSNNNGGYVGGSGAATNKKAAVNPFTDVSEGDSFYDAVLWAYGNEITAGKDDTHFSPETKTSRAHMVTFLWRAAGCPEPTSNEHQFTDVKAGSYYEKAVLWAVENGITNGTSATKFSPGKKVTRAQALTFLWRYSGAPKFANMTATGPAPSPFDDVKTSAYYYNAILWAMSEQITDASGENKFMPGSESTRGEVVTYLYRKFVEMD